MLVGLNSNELLPVIPFIQTEDAANSYRKKFTHISRKMNKKNGSNNRI